MNYVVVGEGVLRHGRSEPGDTRGWRDDCCNVAGAIVALLVKLQCPGTQLEGKGVRLCLGRCKEIEND